MSRFLLVIPFTAVFFFLQPQVYAQQAVIVASPATGNIVTCQGTASASPNIQQFTASGNKVASITITAPAGFEVSLNDATGYSSTLTLTQSFGAISAVTIYVRASATATAGNISDDVVLTAAGLPSQSVTVSRLVNATSTVNAVASQILVNGETTTPVNFTGTANAFSWVNDTPGIGLAANGTGNIPSFAAINTTSTPVTATITVTPLNGNGCNNTANFTITINPFVALSIPNTFTPNGDGINDTWDIKHLDYYTRATVNIFNRWGQKLYSSVGYAIPWDGTYKGKILPPGTYYYIIDPKTGQAAISGWVAIVK